MDDRVRASDADRDAAAAALRNHYAAGRLESGELEERVATVLGARTLGDLRAVLADLPPAEEPEPGRPGLERGYRRLLVCYPAAWRRAHEQEMIAVLMAAAPAGRCRPALADAANLIAGGVRVRCQPTRDSGEPSWRDALAVVSVLLPLFVLTTTAVQAAWYFHHFAYLPEPAAVLGLVAQLTVPLALVGMALLRHHRRAALAVAAVLVGMALLAGWTGWAEFRSEYSQGSPYELLAVAVQLVAVTASPGPRRGLALLTWRGAALTVIAAAAITIAWYPLAVPVVVIIAATMSLSSSLGRWLLPLFAVPVWPYLTSYFYPAIHTKIVLRLDVPLLVRLNSDLAAATSWQGEVYLFPAFLLCLFAAAAWRDSLRQRQLATLAR